MLGLETGRCRVPSLLINKVSSDHPIDRWIEFCLPEDTTQEDAESVRRSRLVVLLLTLGFCAAYVYSVYYIVLGTTCSNIGPQQALVTVPVIFFLFRRYRSVWLVGNLLGLTCTVGVGFPIVFTGGVHSSALSWLFFGPLVAVILAGRQSGIIWLVVSAIFVLVLMAVSDQPWYPESEIPQNLANVQAAVVSLGLISVVTATAWSFGAAQEAATFKLHAANEIAEQARREAESAHADSLLVLDNVIEGLAIVNLAGDFVGPPSAIFQRWFSCPVAGVKLWTWFEGTDQRLAESFEMNWEQLSSDWMPLELAIDQLPKSFDFEGASYELTYRPVVIDDQLRHILVICTDVTAEREFKLASELQREQLTIFTRFVRDPGSVRGFMDEADRLVSDLTTGIGTLAEQKRWVHTLKGNSAIFGLNSFSRWLHRLEDELEEIDGAYDAARWEALETQWIAVRARLSTIVSMEDIDHVTVDKKDFEQTLQAVESGVGGPLLAALMRRWTWDPVDRRLELLAERASQLAERLGKTGVEVNVEAENVRRPPGPDWNAFWGSVVHVVRNAIDHGIESPDDRLKSGKESAGKVTLRAWEEDEQFVFEVSDDGAGIDWSKVAERCQSLGLTCDSTDELQDAVFADGVTTKDMATEISGRGVGMAAVREACQALGGDIEIESSLGKGTKFRFNFPTYHMQPDAMLFYI